jgi:hypothetical protein
MLALNYVMLTVWSPLTGATKESLIVFSHEAFQFNPPHIGVSLLYTYNLITHTILSGDIFSEVDLHQIINMFIEKIPIDVFAIFLLPLCPSLFRLFVSINFCRLVFVKALRHAPHISCLGTDYRRERQEAGLHIDLRRSGCNRIDHQRSGEASVSRRSVNPIRDLSPWF